MQQTFCFIFRNVCFVSTHFKNLVICLILWDFNSAKSRLDRILVFKSMRESRYCVYHRQLLFYKEFSLNTNHVKRQTLIDKVDPSKIYIKYFWHSISKCLLNFSDRLILSIDLVTSRASTILHSLHSLFNILVKAILKQRARRDLWNLTFFLWVFEFLLWVSHGKWILLKIKLFYFLLNFLFSIKRFSIQFPGFINKLLSARFIWC